MLQSQAEGMLQTALSVLQARDNALLSALDQLPAPIYVTDADGVVTYFNPACIGFAGRTPAVGKDRWCVTWKLYTDTGEALPHEQCPMAEAIRSRRTVSGVTAVAERPDGTRIAFMPFATPLLDEDGTLIGAANLLLDITDQRQAAELRRQAVRCRRLAASTTSDGAQDTLSIMAAEYDEKAGQLEPRAETKA
jgi:PAS domain S-box-containing protein